jgi:hypothetical protein
MKLRAAGILILAAWLILWALVGLAILPPAHPRDLGQWAQLNEYQSPDVSQWYANLRQPDYPTTSCCGEADAYFADDVDECTAMEQARLAALNAAPGQAYECAFAAIITDTRDDAERKRRHVEPGTRVLVAKSKIRRVPSENPTEHNVVFLGENDWVYCWEPQGGF